MIARVIAGARPAPTHGLHDVVSVRRMPQRADDVAPKGAGSPAVEQAKPLFVKHLRRGFPHGSRACANQAFSSQRIGQMPAHRGASFPREHAVAVAVLGELIQLIELIEQAQALREPIGHGSRQEEPDAEGDDNDPYQRQPFRSPRKQ